MPARAWQRFAAYLVDAVVWAPVMVLNYYLGGDSPEAGIVANLLNAGLWVLYWVYCHARFGKTFGKHLLRIRVSRTNGMPLSAARVWARSGVDLGFTGFSEAGSAIALMRVSDEAYAGGARWFRPLTMQAGAEPAWAEAVEWIWLAWMVGSFLFLAIHRQKRAPHDLIAGTRVVAEPR